MFANCEELPRRSAPLAITRGTLRSTPALNAREYRSPSSVEASRPSCQYTFERKGSCQILLLCLIQCLENVYL